jgi:hypothetical protein
MDPWSHPVFDSRKRDAGRSDGKLIVADHLQSTSPSPMRAANHRCSQFRSPPMFAGLCKPQCRMQSRTHEELLK